MRDQDEAPAPEPDSRVDLLAMLLVPVRYVLTTPFEVAPDLVALPAGTAAELLEVLEPLLPDAVATFRTAVAAADPTAPGRLTMVVDQLHQTLPQLVRMSVESFGQESLDQAVRFGTVAGRIGSVLEDDERAVTGFWFAGRARWRLQRPRQAVDLLEDATALGDRSPVPPTCLAAAHDLLGLALAQLQRFPDALAHFRTSARLENDPVQRLHIEINRVMVLANAGYVDEAVAQAAVVRERSEHLALPDVQRGQILDNLGDLLRLAGDARAAMASYETATGLLSGAPTRDRVGNLVLLGECAGELGDEQQQGLLFERAWDVAQHDARASIEHDLVLYRDGLRTHASRCLPVQHDAFRTFLHAVQLRVGGDLREAGDTFRQARNVAVDHGDLGLALRAQLNEAAIGLDLGRLDDAVGLAQEAMDVAREEGLSLFEGWAAQLLVSAACQSADAGSTLDAVLLGARATRLIDLAAVQLGQPGARVGPAFTLPDDHGSLFNELSMLAERADADRLGVTQLRRALELARGAGNVEGEALRSANLMRRLTQLDESPGERRTLRARLVELLPGLSVRTTLVVRTLLLDFGSRCGGPALDAGARLAELRAHADLVEQLRQEVAPGASRADVDSAADVYPRLVVALTQAGQHARAWEALQETRARRLLEVLASRSTQPGPGRERGTYAPPHVAEAQELLAAVGSRTTLVDVRLEDDGLEVDLLSTTALRHVRVPGATDPLLLASWGDPGRRAVDLCALARNDPLLRALARAVSAVTEGDDLLLSVDDALSNIPFHLVPVGGQPWREVQLLVRLPAIGLLQFRQQTTENPAGAVVAGDSDGDLPGAAAECREVGALLDTAPLLGEACSAAGLAQALAGRSHRVVHLAVHGFADPRRGGSASLLLGHDGTPTWIPFDALASIPWRADLVTFSGCSTAVGGPRHGRGLYGLTETAMIGGAGTVLASLWPVDDRGTRAFMTAFYADVERQAASGDVDLRLALRAASRGWADAVPGDESQSARPVRTRYLPPDDDDTTAQASALSDPEVSRVARDVASAFTLIGDPIMRGRPPG